MTNAGSLESRAKAMDMADNLPASLRPCVHEFGLAIVTACVGCGVNTPSKIRFLVKEIWAGARQPSQMGNAYETLDWLLMQAGAGISAATLRRLLAEYSIAIVPDSPSTVMVEASMAEVSGHNEIMTKREKHIRRLRAAIRAHTAAELAKTERRRKTA